MRDVYRNYEQDHCNHVDLNLTALESHHSILRTLTILRNVSNSDKLRRTNPKSLKSTLIQNFMLRETEDRLSVLYLKFTPNVLKVVVCLRHLGSQVGSAFNTGRWCKHTQLLPSNSTTAVFTKSRCGHTFSCNIGLQINCVALNMIL